MDIPVIESIRHFLSMLSSVELNFENEHYLKENEICVYTTKEM